VKQTKIDEVAAQHATPPKIHRADEVRGRGSMEDVERIHGTPKPDPEAVKRKAAKQRIDAAAFGVEVKGADEAPAAKPVAAAPATKKPVGRKPREPRE
jgi:hypothetical protein